MGFSEKEETAIEKFDRYRQEGTKYKKIFEPGKEEQDRFYAGEHWQNKDSENRAENHIFQIVEGEIPLLMDPMPSTDVAAHDSENFGDHAMVLDAAKDHVYFQQNIFLKDAQAFRSMLKTGSGFQYVDFDPDGEMGEGSVTLKNLSRKQIIKDPAADTLDECRYIIIDSALSNDDLKRRFPKTWKEAVSQPLKDLYVFAGSKGGALEEQNVGRASGKEANRYDSKDMTFIEEGYFKDYSMEPIPDDETQIQLTEESAQLMQGINPDIIKWEDHASHIPGHEDHIRILVSEIINQRSQQEPVELMPGQMAPMPMTPEQVTPEMIEEMANDPEVGILIQIAQDHIQMHQMYMETMDEDEVGKRPKYKNNLRLIIKTGKVVHFDGEPPVGDGMVPLVEFECYKDEGPAEGIIKNLIPQQKTINEINAKELRGLKRSTNTGWLVDEQSGVDEDTLNDEEGIVITRQQGTDVSRIPPGQVSPQLENRARREYEAMQRIEGVGETVFGEAPKHEASGVMYRRMQMQALGRIRLKSSMIGAAIYRRDLLITTRVMKYWSTERKLRTEDANGKVKFIKFDPRMMRDFTYELIFSPGTTTGMDSETIAETYKEMLNNGQIDLRTYVKLTNLPKKQDLLTILDEKDEATQAIQQLQTQNQDLQTQMLMLKFNVNPQLLTPEELKAVEQIMLQQENAALSQPQMPADTGQAAGMIA